MKPTESDAIRQRILARATAASPHRDEAPWEDPSLYVLALVVGLIPIIAVLVRGGAWGAEPTVGLVLTIYSASALGALLASKFRRGPPRKNARSFGVTKSSTRFSI